MFDSQVVDYQRRDNGKGLVPPRTDRCDEESVEKGPARTKNTRLQYDGREDARKEFVSMTLIMRNSDCD
jgi:hypothetical protein